MRLRVIQAADTREAIGRMRADLGPDALILSTRETQHGVSVTAAADMAEDDLARVLTPVDEEQTRRTITQSLSHHAVPNELQAKILSAAIADDADDATLILTQLLARAIAWQPLAPSGRIMLVGPHGAGKTAATARLAVDTLMTGAPVVVIDADAARAGATAQLTALLDPIGVVPLRADSTQALAGLAPDAGSCIIDGCGVNPFRGEELARLADAVHAARAEPVLVLPAGLDPSDSAEIAANFVALGIRRMLATKLDCARRLGGVVCAAAQGLAIAGAAIGPTVGKGTVRLTPSGLARLLLRRSSAQRQQA